VGLDTIPSYVCVESVLEHHGIETFRRLHSTTAGYSAERLRDSRQSGIFFCHAWSNAYRLADWTDTAQYGKNNCFKYRTIITYSFARYTVSQHTRH